MVIVRLATPLRKFSGGKPEIKVEGSTVREVIENIEARSPGFADKILDDNDIKQFINIFHNNEDIRFQKAIDTEIKPDDVLSILPAVSGG
ncbi:MAG TPA: MoaD/ThiS family protein [Euryarchaeota archaeon]|nr:sulfur carrier protein CysO [archaeon BMS3Bbin15]HDL16009.1 MoaD/ThiS family protein [Euryarchaeota archaeon]